MFSIRYTYGSYDKMAKYLLYEEPDFEAMREEDQRRKAFLGVGKEVYNFPAGTDNSLISGVLWHTPCCAPQPSSRCSLRPCVQNVPIGTHCSDTLQSR
jgi:hypothetical protein